MFVHSVHSMKMLPAPPGTCVHCATKHGENDPHNWWSLFYGMRFKMKWGRDHTHADCVAHLPPECREAYREALREHGYEWTQNGEPIREPYAEAE